MPGKRVMMRFDKGMRYLSSMVLMGALAVPVGLQAQEHKDHDRDDQAKAQMRHDKGNHRWTSNEEPYYRQWYGEAHNGKQYREYSRLNKRDRDAYWKWRDQHNDRDHDRDDHHDKDHDRDHR